LIRQPTHLPVDSSAGRLRTERRKSRGVRADPGCLECFLEDIGEAARLLVDDEERRRRFMLECARFLDAAIDTLHTPSYFITHLHRLLKQETGIETPFADERRRTNEAGMRLARVVRARAARLGDDERLALLIRWATIANSLDFRTAGVGYSFDIDRVTASLEAGLEAAPEADETERVVRALGAASRVLYILDNVGEIALDRLLIEELHARGKQVTAATRGGPITSDVTPDDARAVGICEIADRLITTGPDTLGIPFEEMSPEFEEALGGHDILISKGQANFYALSECRDGLAFAPIAFLLTTKCERAAAELGVSPKSMAIKLL
jgi:uncharacterized protein with ATP-grasp and redox domains